MCISAGAQSYRSALSLDNAAHRLLQKSRDVNQSTLRDEYQSPQPDKRSAGLSLTNGGDIYIYIYMRSDSDSERFAPDSAHEQQYIKTIMGDAMISLQASKLPPHRPLDGSA